MRRAMTGEVRRLIGQPGLIGRLGSCEVVLIRTGIGMAKASLASRAMLQSHEADLVISSGFACALSSSGIGDLLIGTKVACYDQLSAGPNAMPERFCATEVTTTAVAFARANGFTALAGPLVTVPRVIWRAEEKRRLAAASGAIGLDMESAAIAACAAERRVPFAVLRTVSDRVDEDLALDFNLFLNPLDWPRGMWACLSRPSSWRDLRRLRANGAIAAERLTDFFRRFVHDRLPQA